MIFGKATMRRLGMSRKNEQTFVFLDKKNIINYGEHE
jgi:hypothetical protein